MVEKCPCGEDYAVGLDGITKCKNGHEKKHRARTYVSPLSDSGHKQGSY